jgi:hypothetical protein
VNIAELPAFAAAGSAGLQQENTTDEQLSVLADVLLQQQQQQQQQQSQMFRQAWQFADHVPADLASKLLPALKRKRGVTVHPPKLNFSKLKPQLMPQLLLLLLLLLLLIVCVGAEQGYLFQTCDKIATAPGCNAWFGSTQHALFILQTCKASIPQVQDV